METLFYSNISSATYLKYSSTSKIVGFQLNGSNCGMMLDALPADSFAANTAQFITSKTIGSQGGTLAAADFSLTIPAGVFPASSDLKLYKMSSDHYFDQDLCTDTFRVIGLPDEFPETLLPDLKQTGTLTDESFIMVGEELLISSQLAPGMAYHLFPASSNSGFLTYTPRAAIPVRSNTPTSNRFLDFLGITGWKTYTTENGQGHFAIRYPNASVNLSQVTTLGQYLEAAYDTYENMGFSYGGRTSWPIEVTVTNLAFGTYGLFCKSLWGNNSATLQFNQNNLDNLSELRTTAGHEFFHFIQYLYDSRNNYSRGHDNSFSISLHWLDEATAVWAEEKFTNTQNYVSSIRTRCEMAPFDGMEAGTGANIVQAGEHGYGMSAFIKYLVTQYGESIVRDIYLKILEQKHPIQAINQSLNINNNLFMIWEPFLREYVTGNIYNVPKGEFLLYRSGSFLLKSDTDRAKSFTDSYPDLSAKLYMIGLNYPDISPAKAINFTINQDLCDITLFKFRDADSKIQYLSHSSTKSLMQKNLRSLTDDGYHLLVMVSNANYFAPYTNTKTIKLDILVESIAAAITLSASPNTLDADGTSTSTITATVTDDVGDPVEGETVTFTTNSGSLSAGSVDTNANGIASVNYTAPGSAPPGGTSTITATTTNAITETVVITVNAGPSWTGWPNPQWCPQTGTGEYQWGGTLAIYPPNNPDQAIQCTYWGNAQLKWEIPNLNGKKEGWWKSYFESGALKAETPYKVGKREGTSTWFYESGNISSQTPYVNGLAEGNYIGYYENSQIEAIIPHQADLRNGMAHWFYDTGERMYDDPWQNDLRHGIKKAYFRSGPLSYEHPYTNGKKNGMTKGYYENGNRSYETPYIDGKKNGISKSYWESNDQRKSETPYTDDIINGTQFYYFGTGELDRESPYVDGIRHGVQKYYYKNGQVAHSIPRRDNIKHGQEKWYSEAGEMTRCEIYNNGTMTGSCMP
ncbi:MAG: Ig-like domain-containing protein [Pseudomonadota bacterium]|nr:Ig-like domain-containing protein [Pseudomonadota bacterium]